MKTKISGKMILFTIISCAVVVICAVVGCVCHFTGNGFFNFGVENGSDKTVSVNYYIVDYPNMSDVEDVCEKAFSDQGISYTYEQTTENSGHIEYVFPYKTDTDKLDTAVGSINDGLSGKDGINLASLEVAESMTTNGRTFMFAGIAAASIIVLQALYCLIRFKLNMAVLSLVTNVGYVLLATGLMAALRIPFGSFAAGVMIFGLLLSVVLNQIFYTDMKSALRNEDYKELSFAEKTDRAYAKGLKASSILSGSLFVTAGLFALVMGIFARTAAYTFLGVAGMLVCLVAFYSSTFFSPAVYSRMEKVKIDIRRPQRDRKEKGSAESSDVTLEGVESV
ncbi:MAG: hypothetical protein LUD47_01835 [Clostridia bacterium]|nr:hypothetical protein [Clostridia bacterium]